MNANNRANKTWSNRSNVNKTAEHKRSLSFSALHVLFTMLASIRKFIFEAKRRINVLLHYKVAGKDEVTNVRAIQIIALMGWNGREHAGKGVRGG